MGVQSSQSLLRVPCRPRTGCNPARGNHQPRGATDKPHPNYSDWNYAPITLHLLQPVGHLGGEGVTSSYDGPFPEPGERQPTWVYRTQRRLIELGLWAHDHELPSEKCLMNEPISAWLDGYPDPSGTELGEKKTMERRTARDPVIQLAEIGRVIKHQGKNSVVYMPSIEPHRLAVDLRKPSPMRLAMVAEPSDAPPAVEFIPAPGPKPRTRWHEGKYIVPEWDSERLGIDTGTNLHTYTLTVLIGDEPILISITLAPSDLPGGAVTWRKMPVGELALAGLSATFDAPSIHSRIPTLEEEEALKAIRGVPTLLVYRQCQVTPASAPVPSRPACVLVVARADRVRLTGPRGSLAV
jgi:hypothetical protein